jgi:tryptophan synthase alpha chain
MAHIYYGDPSEEFSLRLIKTLAENGVDLIELGIPFSDPIADGATFQAACDRALTNGMTPSRCIQGICKIRELDIDLPIVVTTYFNIPFVRGVRTFLDEIREAGAQGILIPDLPVEEAGDILESGREKGLCTIFMVTPTTTESRLERIVGATSGFLYVVNVEGVTGPRETMQNSTLALVSRVRKKTDIPIMAGFGVSKEKQAVALIRAGAEGVITGSSLARIYEKTLATPEDSLPDLGRFARSIKRGCVQGYAEGTRMK